LRAGPLGALAAWIGFTLPSALLMTAFALAAGRLTGPLALGLIHGLKLVAVAVVAQAALGMARTLTPDIPRAAIALAALGLAIFAPPSLGQIAAIGLGALAGLALCRAETKPSADALQVRMPAWAGLLCLALFAVLLAGGPLAEAVAHSPAIARFDAIYRCGALVFGGGHVVLPLLNDAVVKSGWVSQDRFLAGYGVAQAVPGPLFTFAAYLGAVMRGPPNGAVGALLGLVAIFLPGLLLVLAALPFWSRVRAAPRR
jgi:chromate transporter